MRQHILFLILACAQILGCAAQDTARLMQATSPPANFSAPQTAPSQGSPGGTPASGLDVRLPLESKSIRFAVIGDTGTGEREQYQVSQEMENYRKKVCFILVYILVEYNTGQYI